MKIKDFAEKTGLSESAVRYYERVGVLHPVGRLKNGYREFDDEDLEWMLFVNRLKSTGMPIDSIIDFSRLREQGDSTLSQRLSMLEEHELRLVQEIADKGAHLQELREKIALYQKS